MDGTRGCISVDSAPMEGTEWKQRLIDLEDIMELDTHEHFERAGRSDTCFGELDELSELSDTTLELDELSDTNLELNELNDTEDGAGLVAGQNEFFQPKEKFITNSIWVCFTPNSTRPLLIVSCPFASRNINKGSQRRGQANMHSTTHLFLVKSLSLYLCFLNF